MSDVKVLIVDDERSWREFYEDELRQMGVGVVRSAKNLMEAQAAVESMRFAVAVVDVGLDENDDRNVDGLQVMQRIRDAGDQTSIIVVTGRSGRDVLPIVRDSMKRYGALDAVAKGTLLPAELRKLVESGIETFDDAIANERRLVYDAVRGDLPQALWDDKIMRGVGIDGGAVGLYAALETLFRPFVPLLAGQPKGVQILDDVACGVFWSRGIGRPIVGCFGEGKRIHESMEQARSSGMLLGSYRVGELVKEYRSRSNQGAVYVLADGVRSEYGV